MVEKTIRVSLLLPESLNTRVNDFRFANRINSFVEVVRVLVEFGLTYATIKDDPRVIDIIKEKNNG
jgi:hypothetical protein